MNKKGIYLLASDDASVAANQFQALRNAVLLQSKRLPIKTILVSSPMDGQGKTTVSSNLAISLAQNGEKVLLIEANFRHKEIASDFGVKSVGLSEFILEGNDFSDLELQPTSIQNMDVLPAGKTVSDISSLFVGEKFVKTLEKLENQYSRIIIDGDSLQNHAEMEIVATLVDYVLLVVSHREVKKDLFEDVISNLQYYGVKNYSVVYNKTPDKRNDFDY